AGSIPPHDPLSTKTCYCLASNVIDRLRPGPEAFAAIVAAWDASWRNEIDAGPRICLACAAHANEALTRRRPETEHKPIAGDMSHVAVNQPLRRTNPCALKSAWCPEPMLQHREHLVT